MLRRDCRWRKDGNGVRTCRETASHGHAGGKGGRALLKKQWHRGEKHGPRAVARTLIRACGPYGVGRGAAAQEKGPVGQATSPQKKFEEPPCRWVCIRRTLAKSGRPSVARKSRSLCRACPRARRMLASRGSLIGSAK